MFNKNSLVPDHLDVAMKDYIGLNDTTMIDAIVVNWPSGITTEIYDVNVDQVLIISEYVPEPPNLAAFSVLVLVSFVLFVWRHNRS